MALEYFLYQAGLHQVSDRYLARAVPGGTVDSDELSRMIAAGNSADMVQVRAILEAAFQRVAQALAAGRTVQLGNIVRLLPSMQGSFTGPDDQFDPARHKINVAAVATLELKRCVARQSATHKLAKPGSGPDIVGYRDIASGQLNSIISPGGIGQLNGSGLKFAPEDEQQGLFLVDASGTAAELKVEMFQKASSREIVFAIPPMLNATRIILQIRRRKQPSGSLQQASSVILNIAPGA